jgi:hypothetical protein
VPDSGRRFVAACRDVRARAEIAVSRILDTRGERDMAKKKKQKKQNDDVSEFAANARALVEGKRQRDREALAEHVSLIERRLVQIKEAFFDIGTALKQIRDEELFKAAESAAADFDAFVTTSAWFSRSYAYQLIDIATVYQREQALELKTMSMGIELMQYAKRKHGRREEAQRLAAAGEIEGKKLAELTAEDVARMGRKKSKKKKDESPEATAARKEARLFDEWLSDRGLPGAVARAGKNEDGEWIVEVAIPVPVLARFRAS